MKGYFGIQFLNGFSHRCENLVIKELVYVFDMWIENNYGIPSEVRVSKNFHNKLSEAVGYKVKNLDTVLGLFPLQIKNKKKI